MYSQKLWPLLIPLLVVSGTFGCGEKPAPVVEKPKASGQEPKPAHSEPVVVKKPKGTPAESKVVVNKPASALAVTETKGCDGRSSTKGCR